MSNQSARTIKDLADSTRRRGMGAYGEAAWAMMCMEFEAMFDEAENEYIRYIEVMQLIAGYQTPRNMQLGCVWLDGHGFGDHPVEWLADELARVRQ